MRSAILIAAATLIAAGSAAAQDPALEERPEDLASLAAHLRNTAAATREEYAKALEEAKDNRAEIEGAVEACPTRREKLAMVWLVSKMRGRNFAKRKEDGWDLLPDLETVKAGLLARNVRHAFAARDAFPWCRDLPWDLFLAFVLPYRGSQEPAQDWRPALWKEVEPRVRGCRDAAEALKAVRGWAAGAVKTGKRDPQDLGVLEALEKGVGREEDVANFTLAAVCAAGIPCAAAYTPWWPRADGNRVWNEAWVGGRWVAFSGGSPEAGAEAADAIKASTVFAKVYRKRFAERPDDSETFGEDVTGAYTAVADLSFDAGRPSAPVQLAVWNTSGWRAVAEAKSGEDGKVVFRSVGCREAMVLAAYLQGPQAELAEPPFLFGPGGSVERLALDPVEAGGAGLETVRLESLLPNTAYGLASFAERQWVLVARGTSNFSGTADFGAVGRTRTLYILGRVFGERTLPQGRPFLLEFEDGKAVMKKY